MTGQQYRIRRLKQKLYTIPKQGELLIDEAFILIIGISKYNDTSLNLPLQPVHVNKLVKLWKSYNYDVCICKDGSFDATKDDIIDFVDKQCRKLKSKQFLVMDVRIIASSHLMVRDYPLTLSNMN